MFRVAGFVKKESIRKTFKGERFLTICVSEDVERNKKFSNIKNNNLRGRYILSFFHNIPHVLMLNV